MTTPTGPVAQPSELVRVMLSESATWRSWLGVANPSAALAYVFTAGSMPAAVDQSKPFAHVSILDGEAVQMSARGAFEFSGRVALVIQVPIETADAESAYFAEADVKFCSKFGQVIQDMTEYLRTTTAEILQCRRIVWSQPQRMDPAAEEDQGAVYVGQIFIPWGLGGGGSEG